MAREVVDPDGVTWRIRRRWAVVDVDPPAVRFFDPTAWDFVTDATIFGVVAAVAFLACAALFAFVILPLALLVLEVAFFVAALVVGVAARVLLRRPWTLLADADAHGPDTRFSWRVAGWRASREAIDEIAAGLRNGLRPPPPSLVLPAPERR
ncbi:MAG TPA: hypothetical protein VNT55_08525 [Baekduia sp.]|nr:hypothetical protein [Baekduia sp.]